ncbi:hypothetical protein BC936DRAFT_138040 [Jimgerdemannia flammicorona]|uniref:DDHD domain-containing protein n=1 Tax=Jimgerdemannia flammicorona TaxID=994334 RepID=A0A433CWA3_9FUNG|nr:hypothetical protein BC936DRAFT_138040 [Jimgerdemannia flammicorona]
MDTFLSTVRETTRAILQAKWPNKDIRIELIPIEWHKALHDQVDSSMNRITLKSIPTIRLIENEYLADVLYYFAKDRGQSIIDHITDLFNTSYHNFAERYPNFDGRIAIFGYSLGGICVYDILSHQRTELTEEERKEFTKVDLNVPKLAFTPNFFFGLGSPIGAVMVMRNHNPLFYHPAEDIHFENIFHPFDPLAYRYEPLCYQDYTDEPAVLVDKCNPMMGSFSFPSFPSIPDLMSANGLLASLSLPSLSIQFPEMPKMPSFSPLQEQAEDDISQPPEARLRQVSIFEQARETFVRQLAAVTQYIGGSKTGILVDSEAQRVRTLEFLNGEPKLKRRKSDSDIRSSVISQAWMYEFGLQHPEIGERETETAQTNDLGEKDDIAEGEGGPLADFKRRTAGWFGSRAHGTANESSPAWRHASLYTSGIVTSQPFNAEADEDYFSQHRPPAAMAAARHHHRVEVLNNNARLIDSSRKARLERQHSGNLMRDLAEELNAPLSRRVMGLEAAIEDVEEEDDEFHDAEEEINQYMHHQPTAPRSTILASSRHLTSPPPSRMRRHSHTGMASSNQAEPVNAASERRHRDVLVELDKELREPGLAITKPGQETVDVVEDTTVPVVGSPALSSDGSVKVTTERDAQEQEDGLQESNFDLSDDEVDKKTLALPLKRRIDYVLQSESFMDMIVNEYLVGFRAHFSYWTNKDLLWHVLRRMEGTEKIAGEEGEGMEAATRPR